MMFGMCQYPQKRIVFVKEYNCINVRIVAIHFTLIPK